MVAAMCIKQSFLNTMLKQTIKINWMLPVRQDFYQIVSLSSLIKFLIKVTNLNMKINLFLQFHSKENGDVLFSYFSH